MTDVTQERDQAGVELSAADEQVLRELTERARTGGLKLAGEGGLLGRLTKMVIEGALEGELDDHLGYAKHDPDGRDGGNSRNGRRAKTVITDTGPVELSVPRDRDASFEPKIVAKRQRRLTGVDDMVISLSAKGLTHGEIAAHLAEVYGAEVSKQTISTITDRVMEGMAEWQSRPLDPVYAVIFIDAINVKIREGQVANRPVYLALGVTVDGERDVLGLWAGEHGDGEGAKYWLRVLTEIKNRGTRDVCMLVCDGLKGLPDAVQGVPQSLFVLVMRGSQAEDGQEQGGVVLDLADGGGDLGVAGLADEPDCQVTERGHDAGPGAGPDPGGILTVSDVPDVVDLVLDGPVAADVPGQVDGGGLAGVQAGDDEHRHGGLHLLLHPAPALLHADGAGDVPLDQGDLAGVREPLADVRGGVHDLDGAALAPAVAFLLGDVPDRDRRPVQRVQLLPQLRGVLLDGEHVVREELLADERGVGADGVPGVGGDDVPGQRVVAGSAPAAAARTPGPRWSSGR